MDYTIFILFYFCVVHIINLRWLPTSGGSVISDQCSVGQCQREENYATGVYFRIKTKDYIVIFQK